MKGTNVSRVRILYKTILKLHRGLPQELRVLGTDYVRDEFKRHKSCNPHDAQIFLTQWTNYAITLSEQLGLKGPHTGTSQVGVPLSQPEINQLRDDQIHQLYELMEEAKKPKQSV